MSSTDGGRLQRVSSHFPAAFLILAIILFGYIVFDVADGSLFLGDVDDRLRAIQISQFVSGKGWYDLQLSGVAMPQPYISPWSRIVDAPYAAISSAILPFFGLQPALHFAYLVWPPIMLFGFAAFSVATMLHFARSADSVNPVHFAIVGIAMSYAAFEFSPERIDHHNVQLLALSAALYGVVRWSRGGAILAALGCFLSLWRRTLAIRLHPEFLGF